MPSESPAGRKGSVCRKAHETLDRVRRKFRPRAKDAEPGASRVNGQNPPSFPTSSTPLRQSCADATALDLKKEKGAVVSVTQTDGPEDDPPCGPSARGVATEGAGPAHNPSDVWSAAYREAVASLGTDIDITILKGDSVADLFRQLEQVDKDATQESVFWRGVKYLRTLQVPLEKFKLALDLADPLTSIDPMVGSVFGVVKNVTAIAISLATADAAFAKQIGDMLEQLSYIDDCDTLGQKTDKKDIHKALVLVYQKLLEFYASAFEMLSKKGVKLALEVVLDNGRLPAIVDEFLKHADHLRKLVQKATWEIVEDIKAMLYDHEIARWLGGDKMSRQNQQHASLRELRADLACGFLLVDAMFINWYEATNSQQLAILGEMGSGKTVAMSLLVDELRRRSAHQLPQPKVCYHYCADDGTGERVYVFSALILSLLEQLPGLKRTFFDWYKQTMVSGGDPATSFRALEEWLQTTLDTLDRPLVIAIDGLDECDRQSRNCLIASLRALTQRTPRLKILLSSRPEEEILEQLSGMSKIAMVSDIDRDWIIVEKTVETRLPYLPKDVKALVTETLARRAEGSAIWTKMTVELIEIRGIRALGPMQAFLDEAPQPRQLSQLFVDLFARHTLDDGENQRLAATALEILAVTRRPMSILELAWAAALGATQDPPTSVAALARLADHQRVMSLIYPFVSRVDFNDVRKRQVKLVHQSVKEFVLLHFGPDRSGPQRPATASPLLITSDRVLVRQCTERLEACMLELCIRYLLLRDIGEVSLFSPEHLAMEELPQEWDLFSDTDEVNDFDLYCPWEVLEQNMLRYDPTERGFGELFVYASCHWIEHFGAVSSESLLPALDDIELVCQAGSKRLSNWITQNSRPDCTIKPRFTFDPSLYDPLSITSLYGSEAMLQRMLEHSDLSNHTRFLPGPATGAADQILEWGDLSRVQLLWRSGIGHQIRNKGFFKLAVKQWSNRPYDRQRSHWDTVFGLVNDLLDVMVSEGWVNELFSIATKTDCAPMARLLMDAAQHQPGLMSELLGT
ncbi:hypothetical protein C8A05DRAFT_38527 [Staphylotrichum tortipilum]|uniref:NACHT domain-containing protein n=1 Tax=Staphylotrichum tortipilum TaxID=2831512 RepID=A0AAN6MD92_9PEZI|nr:hypothetical protein C8A05DRAFT_38527 [Staphylotrichum longicolle]